MLGGWKVEGVSELSDLILQSGEAPGICLLALRCVGTRRNFRAVGGVRLPSLGQSYS